LAIRLSLHNLSVLFPTIEGEAEEKLWELKVFRLMGR
jgi:hypothetical protein